MSAPARGRPAALPALALLAFAACAAARPAARPAPPAAERRLFAVPGHGALELAVPKAWMVEVGADEPDAPPTIRVEQPGVRFLALLTPFWNPGAPGEPAGADTAQLFAELARRNALAGSLEREIPLEELTGESARGYWFAATDRELAAREPGPQEWRHVIQGAAAVGGLVVAFTLLDDADGPQRRALLDVVRGARHVGEGAPREEGGLVPDPAARTVPLRVPAPDRPWSVLVELPGFRMFKPQEGGGAAARHVLGQHPASGIVASVILRPAGAARNAAACRDADLARIRDATRALAELELSEAGAAARAAYAIAGAGGVRQEHAHAWLHRDGVCANVHVSKLGPAEGDAEDMERILGSVRFGEEL